MGLRGYESTKYNPHSVVWYFRVLSVMLETEISLHIRNRWPMFVQLYVIDNLNHIPQTTSETATRNEL
jgi:hypothetical protein